MDFINGMNLYSLTKSSNDGLSEDKAFDIFIQVASAVHFLHENKYIHRDLKTENIMIDEENKVKLCDFGNCVELLSGTRNSICGTYEYMAPEVINEISYDYSIDIWSLGILLYELLHGYSPFRSQENEFDNCELEIFKNIMKHDFSIEKEVSQACKDMILSKK